MKGETRSFLDDVQLLMIPGPTPVPRAVLEALARPTEGHSSAAVAAAVTGLRAGVVRAVGGVEGDSGTSVFAFAGSGTAALDAALANCVEEGDPILVVNHGYFGDRFAAVARAQGAVVEEVSCPWGEQVPAEQLQRALQSSGARVVTATHVDTATGVVCPLSEYAEVLRGQDAIFILDAVASAGGMPIEMERHGIDVVVGASQKAFAMPPGLGLLAVGPRALERRRQMRRCRAYFADWLNWLPAMEDPAQRYFATTPTNMLIAAGVAIQLAEAEGWQRRFARHRQMAQAVRRGLRAIGLAPMAEDSRMGDTVTALEPPAGVEVGALRAAMSGQGVAISGAIGQWAGRAVRIGHMGAVGLPELLRTVGAFEICMRELGETVEPGAAVGEFMAGWHAAGDS